MLGMAAQAWRLSAGGQRQEEPGNSLVSQPGSILELQVQWETLWVIQEDSQHQPLASICICLHTNMHSLAPQAHTQTAGAECCCHRGTVYCLYALACPGDFIQNEAQNYTGSVSSFFHITVLFHEHARTVCPSVSLPQWGAASCTLPEYSLFTWQELHSSYCSVVLTVPLEL